MCAKGRVVFTGRLGTINSKILRIIEAFSAQEFIFRMIVFWSIGKHWQWRKGLKLASGRRNISAVTL